MCCTVICRVSSPLATDTVQFSKKLIGKMLRTRYKTWLHAWLSTQNVLLCEARHSSSPLPLAASDSQDSRDYCVGIPRTLSRRHFHFRLLYLDHCSWFECCGIPTKIPSRGRRSKHRVICSTADPRWELTKEEVTKGLEGTGENA